MSVEELRQLRERIEQLMEKGYIRPSSSPYAAPCLMVLKPGDPKTLRLVVDYRQLNQQTVRDRYLLPDIQLMFDEMQGAAFSSFFDAVDGFWQVPMAEKDVEKTAFTTQMGHMRGWLCLKGCRIPLRSIKGGCSEPLAIFPLEKGVYLKASKAKLLKESLRFLGQTLSAKGCQPQHDKVAAVKD
ncbi:hypothetical protein CYMTET_37341 [Cymbomonas tetramitiformis]|uniref:Reverse transcriptase domain-containing protein n=1 Tax=Cymbomonas tetramitiformis TaxID=36881 RepID=A0AAE0F6N9_9CHLO|nr:hypothetical protein CYMTET_37341 [Cymbomonas tetramitiformis]